MMDTNADAFVAAHRHSFRNRFEVTNSDECGCFYCLAVFPPALIAEWTDDGDTAICPRCGIDSIIGGKSGFPVTDMDFLAAMKSHWFENSVQIKG